VSQPCSSRLSRDSQGPGRPGLGLGLYVARRLARAGGGDLRATDPPGSRGARFELRLPLAAAPTPTTYGST